MKIKKVRSPEVLIIGSRFDFSCDYVVSRLRERRVSYARLNSEDLPTYDLSLDPIRRTLSARTELDSFICSEDTLKSIWFRRAIYPRDFGSQVPSSIEGQVARTQWSAFIRSLIIFERTKWMNHPVATYRAEQKGYQLSLAHQLGFLVPETLFTNSAEDTQRRFMNNVAIKGIDTVIAHRESKEYFAFVGMTRCDQLAPATLQAIPVTVQPFLEPKRDLRVTVVEGNVFAAEITNQGKGVIGDWRNQKSGLAYSAHGLPRQVSDRCVDLLRRLELRFGGIDLALTSNGYEFLEVNPTGEWAWLVDQAKLPIDMAIADALIERS